MATSKIPSASTRLLHLVTERAFPQHRMRGLKGAARMRAELERSVALHAERMRTDLSDDAACEARILEILGEIASES